VANDEEPIVVEDFSQLFIGRQVQGTAVLSLDLTKYRGEERGVSRQHAQVIYEDGVFTLIDLGSTNGTWLNQRRLTPGRPYQLHSDDHVLLGQLSLVVCLHVDLAKQEVVVYLRDTSLTRTQLLHLTPNYMAKVVAPYLQAMGEVQQIYKECRGENARGPRINAISTVKSDPVVIVNMDGVGETVQLLRKWVIPWRKRSFNGISPEGKVSGSEMNQALDYLALRILSDLAPSATKQDLAAYHRRFLAPLAILATGNLHLST
jgi:pSer/pThr/pTyr-binding forkhead associated (FHA) protein